ncbi:fatty-acid--CoA ligase [Campylobacter gastrosuis]|uniref:Fatty-acid--CoA ligase n=1 Tax=Campylobacter gastrosuis TaxID=2974576 RepID=A0ABT7HMZ6_9BACT|nr:fatty-acid--CoA ligase [Campylobacter gastrosuis]MDL0088274.1 fatty-acid--CoA ligase [Campylobacter gastrosuis]
MKFLVVAFLILVLVFLVIILITAVLYLSGDNGKTEPTIKDIVKKDESKITIRDLLEVAQDNSVSKNNLFLLVESFIKMPFPKRQKGPIGAEAKEFLSFILLVASHKNADAKLISYLNQESKKNNKEYVVEIDEYEKNGLEQRKKHK